MERVMYDSPDAAKEVTVTGWVSKDGRFYGKNEHAARWDSCTHMICKCGQPHSKSYTMCDGCRDVESTKRYEALPYQAWDGVTPLCLYRDDKYFFSEDDVHEYCACEEIKHEDLQLVICTPNKVREIEYDEYYCDELPEDMSLHDMLPEIAAKFDELNKLIRETKTPISWHAGNIRTSVEQEAGHDQQ